MEESAGADGAEESAVTEQTDRTLQLLKVNLTNLRSMQLARVESLLRQGGGDQSAQGNRARCRSLTGA